MSEGGREEGREGGREREREREKLRKLNEMSNFQMVCNDKELMIYQINKWININKY